MRLTPWRPWALMTMVTLLLSMGSILTLTATPVVAQENVVDNTAADATNAAGHATQTLVDWQTFDLNKFRTSNATMTQNAATDASQNAAEVPAGFVKLELHKGTAWPGITLQLSDGEAWNLDSFGQIVCEVKNLGSTEVTLHLRVDDDPSADGSKHCTTTSVTIPAGETQPLVSPLQRQLPKEIADQLIGMRGNPPEFGQSKGLNLSHICGIVLFMNNPSEDAVFAIGSVVAEGEQAPAPSAETLANLFPLVDPFGQYRHRDWPGKLTSEADFPKRIESEKVDMTAYPGPTDRDAFGGWQAGPQFTATGFFRVEKVDGKWWFVDPDGRLFWSHGVDCVGTSNGVTPVTNREKYFENLPQRDDPVFGKFFGTAGRSPVGYYKDFEKYDFYNQTESNLYRKYGENWRTIHAELAHQRLRSWGLNTIGNWSDSRIYDLGHTPYVATVGASSPTIAGSEGYWGKFPDPFHPEFSAALERSMKSLTTTVDDPNCIGYFVHNELSWGGGEYDLAEATLASPADQPAKVAFLTDLKTKYDTIEALNSVWGTSYASWDALSESREKPDRTKAKEDLLAFTTRIAETYFAKCRQVVKDAAPNQLYLGCRFAWCYERAILASAKYCDVVSFNKYQKSLADVKLPDGVDKPIIIGEFHFGALDRGMFHTGLVPTKDQLDRADHYRKYVESGLRHPNVIGTHWFQYADQATTGRFDGENYQIGFIDIVDTPYPELIDAARQIGDTMYSLRSEAP